jgi:hypothetical protein
MSKEVKLAMLSFIESFKKGGIVNYSGENILIALEIRLDALKALTEEHVHDILTNLSIFNNNTFKSMYKLMAEQADLGNKILPTITAESTSMDAIETVLDKVTGIYGFRCHAKKCNITKKGGGGTFNYSGGGSGGGSGGVKSNLKWLNLGKVGCRPSICDKPLTGELIEKNKRKYMAAKEAW